MKLYKWLKIKKAYNQQIKKLPDEEVEKLIERTFDLFPPLIDIAVNKINCYIKHSYCYFELK